MSFGRRFYEVLVGLHPAAFRRDFGPEMLLDFDEAAAKDGFYWDAVMSLGRQWGRWGFAGEGERVPVGTRFLLEGRYGVIDGDGLSAFEFGRGMVLAMGLFGVLAWAQTRAETRGAGDWSAPSAEARVEENGRAVGSIAHPFESAERIGHPVRVSGRPLWAVEETVGDRGGPTHAGMRPRYGWGAGGQAAGSAERRLEFEVVSIREDKSVPAPGQARRDFGPTANGYRMNGLPMFFILRAAYIPTQGGDSVSYSMKQIAGIPDWVKSTEYDIDAKVAEADIADWRNPALQPRMMRAMLQAMLADRLKLVVHREMKEIGVFEMTVAKGGPKFKPAEASTLEEIRQKHPGAFAAPEGIIGAPGAVPGEFTYFNITVAGFAAVMANMAGRPIEDKTGLTGTYDITYRMDQGGAGDGEARDQVSQFSEIMSQLGLKLTPAKGRVETLVIDHVEKPSEN